MLARARRAFFRANGYVVFRAILPLPALDALCESIRGDLDRHAGPLLRHYGEPTPHVRTDDGRIVNAIAHPHLVGAPDLQTFRRRVLDIYCNAAVAECLAELDGRDDYTLQGGLLFFVSPLTGLHDDSWSCDTFPHGGAFTAWFALEDVDPLAGPPFVVAWRPDHLMSPTELGIEFPADDTPGWSGVAQEQYRQALERHVMREGLALTVPTVQRGDLVVWSTLTPHGSLAGHPVERSRLSMQAIYRPTGVPWGAYTFESGKHRLGPPVQEERRHNDSFTLRLPPGMSW